MLHKKNTGWRNGSGLSLQQLAVRESSKAHVSTHYNDAQHSCGWPSHSAISSLVHKSELFYFGSAENRSKEFIELFCCKAFRYLGIPMHVQRLSNKDWNWSSVEEHFQKKLSSWKGKLLSSGGRLVLIKSIQPSLPMFTLSFFAIPKGVLKRLDYIFSIQVFLAV
jgi:hypothetical protein